MSRLWRNRLAFYAWLGERFPAPREEPAPRAPVEDDDDDDLVDEELEQLYADQLMKGR